jgi:hypothetical protein
MKTSSQMLSGSEMLWSVSIGTRGGLAQGMKDAGFVLA